MARKYFRSAAAFTDDAETEEVSEESWLNTAEVNVHDVDLAIEEGFHTANAYYWAEERAE